MSDGDTTLPINPALLGLLQQLSSSPAMKSASALQAFATEHGFEPALIEILVPALMRFSVEAQAAGKLPQATEFLARVMTTATGFGPEMAKILETYVNMPKSEGNS